MSTPNLAIVHIAAAQTQKEATANTAFDELDQAITELESVNCAGGVDVTPNATTTTFARRLKLTGVLTANINLIVPTSKHEYVIDNQTTGKFSVTVKTAAGTGIATFGTGWGHAQGDIRVLYCDGTNVVHADKRLGGVPDATLSVATAITLPALRGRQAVFATSTSADTNITIPSASSVDAGSRIFVKKTDSAAHNVVLVGTITDVAGNYTISAQYGAIEIESDGTNWYIRERYYGETTGFGNGSSGTAVTTTALGTGSGPAAPQTIVNYLKVVLNGTVYWLPLVQ